MRILIISILALQCLHSFSQGKLKYSPDDLKELNAIVGKWQECWNVHNMESFGSSMKDDVDFVNTSGLWLKGKAAAIEDHIKKHADPKFKTSTWQTDKVDIRYIKPDLAILHIGWGLSGKFGGSSTITRHGVFTWVVVKENNKWLILTVQNTNISG